jgi:hypothetical protein
MATKKQVERWITAREATAILRKNSGRDNLSDAYIRQLARSGKVEVKQASKAESIDGRTNLYKASDVEGYVVKKRDQGKGDTKAARAAGSRRKDKPAA